MIRVVLPAHLRTLAHVGVEVQVEIQGQATQRSVLDALEAGYPMLRGTIRDHVTQERRPFLRFFACEEDLSQSGYFNRVWWLAWRNGKSRFNGVAIGLLIALIIFRLCAGN